MHPCIEYNDIYRRVCSPLQRLGVEFFGYTAVDTKGRAFCLGSKANYAEQYLTNDHANKDVHFLPTSESRKPHYYFWDFVKLSEEGESIYRLAHHYQQGHTLTITKQTKLMTQCYHFSGDVKDEEINQRYLSEMDFFHSFVDYFDDCLVNIPEIARVYDHPVNYFHNTSEHDFIIMGDDPKALQFEDATSHIRFKNFSSYYLTEKERRCLYWLHRGKSLSLISKIMDVSNKTIERHVASIKQKYECYTLYQLGQNVSERGISSLLDKMT